MARCRARGRRGRSGVGTGGGDAGAGGDTGHGSPRHSARVARPVLRGVPQRPHAPGRPDAAVHRHRARRPRRRRGRGVGEGRPQAAGPGDAAAGPAAARARGLRRGRARPRDGPRRRRGRRPQPGPPAHPPPEPRRVPQRRPRSARPGDRRARVAAARRVGLRVRQHRRRAGDLAGAARPLHGRGREDQPARPRRRLDPARRRDLHRPLHEVAGRPHERGAAVRLARRPRGAPPLPPRRRVRHPPRAAARLRQPHPRAAGAERHRAAPRPRPHRRVHGRRRRGAGAVERGVAALALRADGRRGAGGAAGR